MDTKVFHKKKKKKLINKYFINIYIFRLNENDLSGIDPTRTRFGCGEIFLASFAADCPVEGEASKRERERERTFLLKFDFIVCIYLHRIRIIYEEGVEK